MEETVRLLVVDDEDRIRRLLNMYLSREGFEIDEAVDGAEALKWHLPIIMIVFYLI